jgi:hypothetical protein
MCWFREREGEWLKDNLTKGSSFSKVFIWFHLLPAMTVPVILTQSRAKEEKARLKRRKISCRRAVGLETCGERLSCAYLSGRWLHQVLAGRNVIYLTDNSWRWGGVGGLLHTIPDVPWRLQSRDNEILVFKNWRSILAYAAPNQKRVYQKQVVTRR